MSDSLTILNIRFPQEVIDYIIDHLHNDHTTLKNCALVCRSWLSSSRFHLFHSISFNPFGRGGLPAVVRRTRRLYRCFEDSPHIAQLIQVVWLSVTPTTTLDADSVFALLLPKLTNVKHFSLMVCGHMSADLQHSLNSIIHLPSLWHLSISAHPSFLISFLSHSLGTQITRLTLHEISFRDDPAASGSVKEFAVDESGERQSIRLEVLELFPLTPSLCTAMFMSPRLTFHLTSLCLNPYITGLGRLLQVAGASIEHLSLCMDAERTQVSSTKHIDLSYTPRLRTLYLSAFVLEAFQELSLFVSLLDDIRSPRPLENITIAVHAFFQQPPDMGWPWDWTKWESLDRALMDTESCPRRVDIDISGIHHAHADVMQLEAQFPKLRERNILHIR